MTDTNPVVPVSAPQMPEIKPMVQQPIPAPSPTPPPPPPPPPNPVPPVPAADEAVSRLKSEPEAAKVLTAQEVSGKPGIVVLALVALLVLAGAATAFYLNTLGSAKPQNSVVEGTKP